MFVSTGVYDYKCMLVGVSDYRRIYAYDYRGGCRGVCS